jgi:type IV pilus assembly protein PilF
MMNTLIRKGVACCAVILSLSFIPRVDAQSSSEQTANTPWAPAPKDARTRARVHTELGSLYFQDGDLITALEELTIAAAIDPDYAPALSTRGLVLYYVKEFDSAEKDLLRALSLDERNPEIANNYGWFLCETGRVKESLEYFERAYKNPMYQTPANAYLNMGACYLKLGKIDQADDVLHRSLRLMPENPKALYHLADVYYRRGNHDAAKKQLMEASRLVEPGPEMLWLSLRVERQLGNQEEEQSLLAQLRRKFPDSAEYQELLKRNFQ